MTARPGISFELGPSVDPEALRRSFEADGYVHVPGILNEAAAVDLRDSLVGDTTYNYAFNDGSKHVDLPIAQVQAMSQDQVARLQQAIYAQAQKGFQYCYNNYPIYDVYRAGKNKGHPLHQFYEWINSDPFLAFARDVTGYADIAFADAQATRYRPGHFLTCHDDSLEGKNRRAAYIFNFTPAWLPDWGGYLQLLDDNDNIRRGFRPSFNALNIIAVPQKHNVSLVAPFAAGERLSVSGWLRYGAPDS